MRAHCLQHVPFEGLGSIERWLCAAGAPLTTTRFFESPHLPASGDVDFLIVMGGPMSANDVSRWPWLAAEQRFIRDAIERGTRVLGVCLGAQLIARAMGARVYPNAEREIGWFQITGMSADAGHPAWAQSSSQTTVFHWHGETFDLPPDAIPLARSAGCEHQAFAIGRHVLGLQFHLEVMRGDLAEMIANGRAELVPSRYVQSAETIMSPGGERFDRVNALMAETIDTLWPGDR